MISLWLVGGFVLFLWSLSSYNFIDDIKCELWKFKVFMIMEFSYFTEFLFWLGMDLKKLQHYFDGLSVNLLKSLKDFV